MTLRTGAALLGVLLATLPTIAWAQGASDLDSVARQISEIEDQVASMRRGIANEDMESPRRVEERLTDAELLFNMQDYTRASLLYLDVVENHETHPGFPEALFRLGESLFHSRNYYGARTRYREVLDLANRPGFRSYAQAALGRLIEIAIHLDEFDGVETYFTQLSQLPPAEVTAATHYARGRFMYHREDYAGAAQAFSRVTEGSGEYLRAQYHLGVIYTRNEEYPQAIEVFERIGRAEPDNADDRQVADLAQVGIGALRLEMDQPEEAIRAYQNVSRNSRVFDQALYQAAAAFSRLGDSGRAEQVLEVLTVATPDSRYIPRAKILRGNLLLDTGRFSESREVFEDVVQRYQPVREQLEEVLERNTEPSLYFQELVRANLEVFDVSSFLPPLAVQWVQEEEGFARSMETLERTSSCGRMIRDTERILVRLEAAVNGPSAVNIFPGLRQTASRSIQIENRLARIRGRLAAIEGQMAGGGGGELNEIREERRRLERELRELPTDAEDYESQEEQARVEYRRLGGSLARLNGRIDRLQAMAVAIELYLRELARQEGEGSAPAGYEAFEEELRVHRNAIETYRAELVELRTLVETGQIQVGIGDDRSQSNEQLRERYNDLVRREREVLSSSGGGSGQLRRAEELFQRAEAVQRTLDELEEQILQRAQGQSQEVQNVLAEERTNMERYARELADLEAEAEDVIGHAAYQNFQRVRERFYELVRQGDVGIIDVAWAEREEHRTRIDRLSEESRRRLQALDDEFNEVMDAAQSSGDDEL